MSVVCYVGRSLDNVLITKRIYTECLCVCLCVCLIVCTPETSNRGCLGPILTVVQEKGLSVMNLKCDGHPLGLF